MSHVHESPLSMTIPLAILAAGAVAAGFVFYEYFVGHHYEDFWRGALFLGGENVLEAAHHVPTWVKLLPLIMSASGFVLAWVLYIKATDIPGRLAAMHEPIYKFLLNKWYFDELYDFLFVRPSKALGVFLWKKGDGRTIDGFGPDGLSAVVLGLSRRARKLQSGYLYHYAFAMLIGVAIITTWFMTVGG